MWEMLCVLGGAGSAGGADSATRGALYSSSSVGHSRTLSPVRYARYPDWRSISQGVRWGVNNLGPSTSGNPGAPSQIGNPYGDSVGVSVGNPGGGVGIAAGVAALLDLCIYIYIYIYINI